MIKKGGEQKNNNNNQEIKPFHAKYAIPSKLHGISESTYYRFIKCKIGGYRVDS